MPTIVGDFRKLLGYLPPLAGPSGKGTPLLGPEEIRFNGRVPDDYETFHFPGNLRVEEGWTFGAVKTGHRPYDLAVVAVLTIAKFYLGTDLRVLSDGSLQDVAPGVALVERILGYPVDPFYLLGREILSLQDGEGKTFFVEAGIHKDREEVLEWLQDVLDYQRFFGPKGSLPLTPPFHLVEEEVPPMYRLKPVLPRIYTSEE
ncbi:MAG: hypothetical protein P3W93_003700 [Thermus sp.]|nr:hypothetical protein [Thermus sp.]